MYCIKCGAALQSSDKFCTECGNPVSGASASAERQQTGYSAQQASDTGEYQGYAAQPTNGSGISAGRVSFTQAIRLFFQNYVKFSGRSSRSEFWWAFLFLFLVNAVCGIIDSDKLTAIWNLVILIPDLALLIRREHDIGRDWTRILLALIPVVGWIILIVDCAKPGTGDNRWGPANPN